MLFTALWLPAFWRVFEAISDGKINGWNKQISRSHAQLEPTSGRNRIDTNTGLMEIVNCILIVFDISTFYPVFHKKNEKQIFGFRFFEEIQKF